MRSLFAPRLAPVATVDHDAYRTFTNHYKTTTERYADSPAFQHHRATFADRLTSEFNVLDAALSVRKTGQNQYHLYLDNVLFGDAVFERPDLVIQTPMGVDTLALPETLHIENIGGRIHEHIRMRLRTYREQSLRKSDRELAHDLERFGAFLERHRIYHIATQLLSDIEIEHRTALARRIGLSFKPRHVICHDHHVVVKTFGHEDHVAVYGDVGTSVVVYSHFGDFTLDLDADQDFTRQIAHGLQTQQDRLEQVRDRFKDGVPDDISREDIRSLLALQAALRLKERFDNLFIQHPFAFKHNPLLFATLACTVTRAVERDMDELFCDLHYRIDLPADYTPANRYGLSDLNWAALYAEGRLTYDACGGLLLDNVRIGQTEFREDRKLKNMTMTQFLKRHGQYDLVHPLGRLSFRRSDDAQHYESHVDAFLTGAFDRETQVFLSDTTQTMTDVTCATDSLHHRQLRAQLSRRLTRIEDLHHRRTRLRF